jgi:hypothetical protein
VQPGMKVHAKTEPEPQAQPTTRSSTRSSGKGGRLFSQFFIERPIFAMVLSIVIVLTGLVALVSLPIARYPEITPGTIKSTAHDPRAHGGRGTARRGVRAGEASYLSVPSGRRDAPGQACWHGTKGRVRNMERRHVCQRLHAAENQQPFVITVAPLGHRA